MAGGRLTRLQERILSVLAPLSPPWTLTTGGAALAAVDAQHRDTRDLDLLSAHCFFTAAAIFLRVAGETVRLADPVARNVRGRLQPRGVSAPPTSTTSKRSAVRRISFNCVTRACAGHILCLATASRQR